MTEIETERLLLRQFRADDFEAYADMVCDPQVMRFIGNGAALSRTDAWRHLAMVIGHWYLRGYGMWALEEKSFGQILGRVGYLHPEGHMGCELGWTLRRAFWGKGYASEAAQAALAFGFRTLKLPHVISLIHPENRRSIRVAERLGEMQEGTTEMYGHPVAVYGVSPLRHR